MSVRRLSKDQPGSFCFTQDNRLWAESELRKYPKGRGSSAVLSLLWRAQKQGGGFLSLAAIRHVSLFLDMSPMRVYEIATFYSMFNLSPVGRYFIQLCGTVPCWLCGSLLLRDVCLEEIGAAGAVSEDGLFSWQEVECLGACVNAPVVQINDDYYEDLDAETFRSLLHSLRLGETILPGSQLGRRGSAPICGARVLHGESGLGSEDK